jgi:hypothetical protein
MNAGAWMQANLTTQGYFLTDAQCRELSLGPWFSTGLCLTLVLVGALLTTGATTAGLVLGGLLLAACATVTAANLCLPSEALAWWERRSTRRAAPIT